jgi:hypothetical protein
MRCPKCGAEIARGSTLCRFCLEPVKREGFLRWLLRALGGVSVKVVKTSMPTGIKMNVTVSEKIKIRDSATGELREYHSLEEVPMEYREKIRQAREAAIHGKGGSMISVTNAAGQVQTYHSPDEMPPDVRAIYDKARGEGA